MKLDSRVMAWLFGVSLVLAVIAFDIGAHVRDVTVPLRTQDVKIGSYTPPVAGFTPGVASRLTALDANHLHAWELTETSGTSFADTGSSATKVALTIPTAANVILATKGLLGPAPYFGITSAGASVVGGACALVSAFTDLPASGFTIEAWVQQEQVSGSSGVSILTDDYGAAVNLQFLIGTTANDNYGANAQATTFNTYSTSALVRSSTHAVHAWQYLVYTYDGANQTIYADGEEIGVNALTGSIQWTATSGTAPKICIAQNFGASIGLAGRMSRIRLSNIVRSQTALRAVWQKAQYY